MTIEYLSLLFSFFAEIHLQTFKGHEALPATQCSHLLGRTDITGSLKNESFDPVVVDAIGRCTFLVVEKLGRPFVTILTNTFGILNFGLPEPVS